MADVSISKFTQLIRLQGQASVPSLPPSTEDTPPAVNPPGSGGLTGVNQFIQLTDTPATYSGGGAKAVAVKSDESGLEFVDFPTVTGGDEPTVKTTASADQNLPSGVLTILDFDTTLTNNATLIYSVATDGRITVSDNGVFDITAGVVIEANAVTALESAFLGIFRNGDLIAISSNDTTVAAGNSTGLSCSTQISLLSGDIIDCRVLVNSVGGVANGIARRLGLLLGSNATQVNSLTIVKCISNGQSFTQLSDTPSSYSGATLNYARVNAGETGLEFRTPAQVLADIGGIGGTIASGQVAFGTAANTIGGDSSLTWDNVNSELNLLDITTDPKIILTSSGSGGVGNPQIILKRSTLVGLKLEYFPNVEGRISAISSSTAFLSFYTGLGTNESWRIESNGNLRSFGTKSINSSSAWLLLQSTGLPVGIGNITPTNTLDVNGTARIRTINNLGSTPTEVLVPSATGVVSKRTLAEFKSDLAIVPSDLGQEGATDGQVITWNNSLSQWEPQTPSGGGGGLWTNGTGFIYRDGPVQIGKTTATDGGLGNNVTFLIQSKFSSPSDYKFIQYLDNSGSEIHYFRNDGLSFFNSGVGYGTSPLSNIAAIYRSLSDTASSAALRAQNQSGSTLFTVDGNTTQFMTNTVGFFRAALSNITVTIQSQSTGGGPIAFYNFAGTLQALVDNNMHWRSNGGAYFGLQSSSGLTTNRVIIRGIGTGTTSTLTLENSTGSDTFQFLDNGNLSIPSTNGAKIGTATSQKLGFWNATPIVQPDTSVAEGTFVENLGGTIVNVDSTFDGYTLQQVVRALRNTGLLA